MLKKYKLAHSAHHHHEHGPDCGHDHHHHEHGPDCQHDHHDHAHHDDHEHDDLQHLFEERDFSMLKSELQSHDHDHSYDLALIDWETAQTPAALAKLEHATQSLKPQTAEHCVGLLNLGLAYTQQKQNEKAKTALESALKIARSDTHLATERAVAEQELAKLNAGSLKDKMLGFFK